MSTTAAPRAKRLGRPPDGQPRLNRQAILSTALALVDEHGMKSLSMRRLARELDVDPMSIYHHVPSKAALVSGLVEAVFTEMRLPEVDDSPWQDRVRSWVLAYRELTRAHPNLVLEIVTDTVAVSQAAALISAPLQAALGSAGLAPSTIPHAAGTLVDFVHGFALGEAGIGTETAADDVDVEQLGAHHPVEPATKHLAPGASQADGLPAAFETGLAIMIRGLSSMASDDSIR